MTDIVADARQVVTSGGGPYDEMWDGAPHDLVLLLCDEIERLRKRIIYFEGTMESVKVLAESVLPGGTLGNDEGNQWAELYEEDDECDHFWSTGGTDGRICNVCGAIDE